MRQTFCKANQVVCRLNNLHLTQAPIVIIFTLNEKVSFFGLERLRPNLCLQLEAEVDTLSTIPWRNSHLKFNSKRLPAVDFSLTKGKSAYLNTTRTLGVYMKTHWK